MNPGTSNQPGSVRIWSVGSYEETAKIRRAVETLFEEQAESLGPLLRAGRDGLAVVKPNWVQESHEYDSAIWEPVITHPAVLLAVVDSLAGRMRKGTICICDAPNTYATFDRITERGGLRQGIDEIRARWPDVCLEVLDLRREVWLRREEVVVERRPNVEDPRGYVVLDLARESLLFGHRGEGRYYGADYDASIVNARHRRSKHEYLLAGTAVGCHLFVNIPKLKTHKKTGVTCCLKNLVGVNGDKNWLPHHTEGSPATGGDEFPTETWATRLESGLKKLGRRAILAMPRVGGWSYRKMRGAGKGILGDSSRVIRNGNWHGNDTCWRMVLDLNRALLYGAPDGTWREPSQRKAYLAIVDGIVGGQGDGPLCPDPAGSRVLITGSDPASVDAVASYLMGFDPREIPVLRHAFDEAVHPIHGCRLDDVEAWDERVGDLVPASALEPAVEGGFEPHFGWRGHLGRSRALSRRLAACDRSRGT